MKRLLIILSLVVPAGLLLLFRLFPAIDVVWERPLLHFYLVVFFTFVAAVVALFTAVSLGEKSEPRHRLLATAFAVMGILFLVHGITTPQAIIFSFNPGIRWAAWLTLFTGGLIFALAALDTPQRPYHLRQMTIIHWALAIFCGGFILIVAFVPQWLAAIDEQASPWHQQLVFVSTLFFWLWAAIRLAWTWRQTRHQVDGVMALIAAWFAIGAVSMHAFPTWQLSWWLYHVQLLLGVGTAVIVLGLAYEQVRRFRLTTYYAATGLITTAALALLASHFFSQAVERNLPMETTGLIQMVVRARLNGLLVASLTMGLFYAAMFFVIRRADRLVTSRSQELTQAYADLQASEAMRDDLTDMIVHDLRSPLTSISLGLDLLEKSIDNPERRKHAPSLLTGSKTSVQRMTALIDQLLDVARLEMGRLQIVAEPAPLAALLREKAAQFIPQAENDGKQLEFIAEPNLPVVSIDRELISRVLDNLLSNALKYTRKGGHVALRAIHNGQSVVVQVVDDGEGVAPEQVAQIFDKFYQVKDDAGKPIRRGTGLGLTFCKLVVEAHNGRIWLESQPGHGSTFSFTLPLDPT